MENVKLIIDKEALKLIINEVIWRNSTNKESPDVIMHYSDVPDVAEEIINELESASKTAEPMSAEESNNSNRSELWNDIYKIISQIPRKDSKGDAMDYCSASTNIEKLFAQSLPGKDKIVEILKKHTMVVYLLEHGENIFGIPLDRYKIIADELLASLPVEEKKPSEMPSDEVHYKKIIINGPEDYPEDGTYFCCRAGFLTVCDLKKDLPEKYYMREIRWYLKPV